VHNDSAADSDLVQRFRDRQIGRTLEVFSHTHAEIPAAQPARRLDVQSPAQRNGGARFEREPGTQFTVDREQAQRTSSRPLQVSVGGLD
jgi:hypothetical protein